MSIYASAGREYGHVPGHNYHDVDVEVTGPHAGRYVATATETWGSAQGHDEEHGRNEIGSVDGDPVGAVSGLIGAAESAGWEGDALRYLHTAVTRVMRDLK
jgi:hypothetical protein